MATKKTTGKKLADMMYGNPEGAAFGVYPMIGKRREDRQDREAAKSFPVDLARGVVAGAVGMPGDIESLVRLPYELITGNESPTFLPTSEDVLKRIPFGTDTPAGQFASGLGTLAGGSAPLGPAVRGVKALPGALKTAARNVSTPRTLNPQAGSVRVKSPGALQEASGIAREGNPIQGAVVLIGDRMFMGRTHGDALNRAVYEGAVRKEGGKYIFPKGAEINSDLFITNTGQIIDRYQALKMADIGASETAIEKGLMQNNPARSMSVDSYMEKARALKQQRDKFQAPQDEAMRLAQQRAALPIEQGGLGLPANNTPEQRAKAMGISTDAYHGTKQDITGAFKPGYDDNLAFVTKSPEFANKWIGKGKLQQRSGEQAQQEVKSAEDAYREMKSRNMNYDNALNDLKGEEFNAEYDRRSALARMEAEAEFGSPGYPDRIHSAVYPLKVEANRTFNPETDMDVMAEFFEKNEIPPKLQDLYASGNYMMYETKPVVEYLKSKGYDSMRLRESTGDDYPTIAVFNPETTRSRFAAFDPFRKDVATAAAMGVLAPDLLAEEAPSRPVHFSDNPDVMQLELARGGAVRMQAGGLPKRLIDAGAKAFKALKPEKEAAVPLTLPRVRPTTQDIMEAAERVGKQQAGEFVRSPLTTKTTNLAGRSKKEVDRLKKLEYKVTPIKDLPEMKPYEAKIGEVNIVLPGDQTISDMLLESVDGIPIGTTSEGGALFGRGRLADPEDTRAFWASNIGPAGAFQRKVTELAKLYDTDMVTAYHLAMGQTANNFAQHLAEANMRAIDFSKLDKKKMNLFDREIAEGFLDKKDEVTGKKTYVTFPEWMGIASPEEALAAMKENPELRKWFNDRMKTEKSTKKSDLPYGKSIEWAMTEPELRNMEINLTGLSAGRMKPGAELIPDSAHQTYSHDIPGTALGRAPELSPFSISFPDATAFVREKYRPQDFTGTIQKVFPHQVVDEPYLEDMYKYYTQLRKVRGYNEGGAVRKAAGGEITADDLILEERKL